MVSKFLIINYYLSFLLKDYLIQIGLCMILFILIDISFQFRRYCYEKYSLKTTKIFVIIRLLCFISVFCWFVVFIRFYNMFRITSSLDCNIIITKMHQIGFLVCILVMILLFLWLNILLFFF